MDLQFYLGIFVSIFYEEEINEMFIYLNVKTMSLDEIALQ